MRERLTHSNLQSNPHASFLFMEHGAGYQGVRLFLKKSKEETGSELIARMTRRSLTPEEDRQKGPKFLVYLRCRRPFRSSEAENAALPRPECTRHASLRSCLIRSG